MVNICRDGCFWLPWIPAFAGITVRQPQTRPYVSAYELSPGQKLHIAKLDKGFSVRAAATHEPVSRRDADAAAGVLTVHFSRTEDPVKRMTLSIEDEIGQGP
jgi:hypothetical protein